MMGKLRAKKAVLKQRVSLAKEKRQSNHPHMDFLAKLIKAEQDVARTKGDWYGQEAKAAALCVLFAEAETPGSLHSAMETTAENLKSVADEACVEHAA
jgi:hypothetical protein